MVEPLKIYDGEAAVVAPLLARPPGTYEFPVELRGNALVSTVWVDDLDGATITATWKDHNPLTSDLYTVHAHAPIVVGYNREFIAEATHGVSILVITVAGGTPLFGAFVTANQLVGNFASPDSVQTVDGEVTIGDPGEGIILSSEGEITVGPEALILSYAVPADELWVIRYAEVACRGYGRWQLTIDGVRVAGGVTSAVHEHDRVDLPPGLEATEGQVVELLYTYNHGPANLDIDAFVGVTVV